MYDTEDSSAASSSYEDQDEMEHFINRCSICFDAQLDLCLEYCKDQYCIDCFEKYITEVVKSSWGLSVTPIRCPVCTELIPKHEWSQYVPQKIVDMYDTFNKPYRSYTRACSHCETEMIPCPYNNNIQSNSRLLCDMMEDMLRSCKEGESHKNHKEHIAVKRWIPIYKRQDLSDSMLPNLYKDIMNDVLQFEKTHIINSNQHFAHNISLQFLKLYVKPEVWKQIQFDHIRFFPNMNCPDCKSTICLHCGYDAHETFTCEDNMKEILTSISINKDIKDTVKWKLKNSRRCPNCSIMINRDEGCNKVDCSYCGFCFCWACKSSWANGCGFYRCSNVTDESYNNHEIYMEEKTEVGVPNMKNIQAKLVSQFHREQ